MSLAAVLGFYLLSLGPSSPWASRLLTHIDKLAPVTSSNSNAAQSPGSSTSSSSTSSPQPQAAPAQKPNSANTPATQSSAKPNPASAKPHTHAKKAIYPDCSNAPTALNPVLSARKGAHPDSADQTVTSANSGPVNGNSRSATPASSSHSKPCPPPKKIVRNGGADDPKIELLGGTPADQASNERSTEQITTATEENLKKIAERQLNSDEKETVNQIKQFIEESKQAVAAGDQEGAHNLATKARLLSEQLIGP
jgi:hypothetical protein